MKILLNLAWLTIALTDVALGYFVIWDYAQTPDFAVVIMAIGLVNAYWAITGIRSPKARLVYSA